MIVLLLVQKTKGSHNLKLQLPDLFRGEYRNRTDDLLTASQTL